MAEDWALVRAQEILKNARTANPWQPIATNCRQLVAATLRAERTRALEEAARCAEDTAVSEGSQYCAVQAAAGRIRALKDKEPTS